MATSPEVEEIKSKLDIVDVIGRYLPLKRTGANWKAPCPFHPEKTPSFMVSRERQSFKCFGCNEAGDVFSFVMKHENVDFPQALELLAGLAGVTLPERKPNKSGATKRDLYQVNDLAAKFYHYVLMEHPMGQDARDYMSRRGVARDTLVRFLVGYAPMQRGALRRLLADRKIAPAAVREAGNPDRFFNRVMFPLRDTVGNVVGFTGRAMGDAQPKYLNSPDTPLFHKNRYLYGLYEAKQAIARAKSLILVEGQLDVILSHQAGVETAVAPSGTALTEDHLALVARYAPAAVVAFDADDAGRKATSRAIHLAATADVGVTIAQIPEGRDPGDVAGETPDTWRKIVAEPVEPLDWLLAYHFPAGSQMLDTAKRHEVYDALFPYVRAMGDDVNRANALQRLARLLGVTDDASLSAAFKSWQPNARRHPSRPLATTDKSDAASVATLSDEERRERHVVALALLYPQFLAFLELRLTDDDLTSPAAGRLYTAAVSSYTSGTTQSRDIIASVLATLSPADRSAFESLIFDTQVNFADASSDRVLEDYVATIERIRTRRREERMRAFASRIAQAEAAGNRDEVVRLMAEMQSVSKRHGPPPQTTKES